MGGGGTFYKDADESKGVVVKPKMGPIQNIIAYIKKNVLMKHQLFFSLYKNQTKHVHVAKDYRSKYILRGCVPLLLSTSSSGNVIVSYNKKNGYQLYRY